MNDEYGWIYCLTNESIQGQVKVGQTGGNPVDRAKQISGTGVPTPHKVEFAKKVKDYKQKERQLHKLLAKYEGRTNPKREFFKCSPETVRMFFDLIDGEWLNLPNVKHNVKPNTEKPNKEESIIDQNIIDLTKDIFLMDGMDIKHIIKEKGFFTTKYTKHGKYKQHEKAIICDKGKIHRNLNEFVNSHYESHNLHRKSEDESKNIYYECYGKWYPIANLLP